MKKVVNTHKQGMPFNRSGDVIRKSKSHRCKTSNNWFRNSGGLVQFDTVLFVPATSGAKLATILKNLEAQNVQGRRSRIKVVERSGKCVKDLLSKSYPWPTDIDVRILAVSHVLLERRCLSHVGSRGQATR